MPTPEVHRGTLGDSASLIVFLARPRSFWVCVVWLLGTLAVCVGFTYLRIAAGVGTAGMPLAFFFPAVIVVALVAGWGWGLVSLVLSAAIVWLALTPPAFSFHPMSTNQIATLSAWAAVCLLVIALAHVLRAAVKRLLRSEMRYRRLIETISDIVWVNDAAGNVCGPHPAWEARTGMAWPQYAGTGWIEAVHEEDRARLQPARGAMAHDAEFRLRDNATGGWRWYASRAVALTDENGNVHEWITTIRDVHEERLAREQGQISASRGTG